MPPASMTDWHLRDIRVHQGKAIVVVLSEIIQISTTWSHNCCGLFPYLKILPSFSLAHICSTTFKSGDLGGQGISSISGLLANHLWMPKLKCTGWLSCWKIKFPSGFRTPTEGSIKFSKICTYCGALNWLWMRSSTPIPAWDIQPQHDKLNRPDLSRHWGYASVKSGAWLTINVSPWFTIEREGRFVGEDYASPIKIPPTSCEG